MLTLVGKIGAVSRFKLQRVGDDGIGRRESRYGLMAGSLLACFFCFVFGELGKMFLGLLAGILCFQQCFEWFTRCWDGHVIGIDLEKV